MSTKMTPQLRFPEFTDEWQVKKLGDVDVYVADGNYGEMYPKSSEMKDAGVPFIRANNLKNGKLIWQDMKYITPGQHQVLKSGHLKTNDILITTRGDIGITAFVTKDFDDANINAQICLLRTGDNLISEFVFQTLQTRNSKKQVMSLQTGSALKQLPKGKLALMKFGVPSKPEQEKIADFLTAVDDRIAVSEKKLELLETYKRGVMQKIFSQQVRFKDENGNPYPDWEEKKLSDVLKERNTQTPISGEYPLMAFVAYKGVAPKGDRYNREFLVSDAKSKKYKQTQLGDFIYSSNNLETGSIGLNLYGSASISPVYSIFETKDGYSHQFLGAYLTRKKFIYQMVRYRQGVVYGQWRIHESEFLKIEEKFPCTGEQQKIADFLTTLDEKITAEKSKLTAAREFKKALLQRMFA